MRPHIELTLRRETYGPDHVLVTIEIFNNYLQEQILVNICYGKLILFETHKKNVLGL